MKNTLSKLGFIFTLVLSIIIVTSCNKESEGEKATNDLLGTWTFSGTDVELTANGQDIIDYMTSDFGYTQEQAQMLVDIYTAGIEAGNTGTINFKDDNTYHMVSPDGNEDGTWSMSEDGNTLTVKFEQETDNLTVVSLSSSALTLKLPSETEEVDFDDDGDNETTLEIKMELKLTK